MKTISQNQLGDHKDRVSRQCSGSDRFKRSTKRLHRGSWMVRADRLGMAPDGQTREQTAGEPEPWNGKCGQLQRLSNGNQSGRPLVWRRRGMRGPEREEQRPLCSTSRRLSCNAALCCGTVWSPFPLGRDPVSATHSTNRPPSSHPPGFAGQRRDTARTGSSMSHRAESADPGLCAKTGGVAGSE